MVINCEDFMYIFFSVHDKEVSFQFGLQADKCVSFELKMENYDAHGEVTCCMISEVSSSFLEIDQINLSLKNYLQKNCRSDEGEFCLIASERTKIVLGALSKFKQSWQGSIYAKGDVSEKMSIVLWDDKQQVGYQAVLMVYQA